MVRLDGRLHLLIRQNHAEKDHAADPDHVPGRRDDELLPDEDVKYSNITDITSMARKRDRLVRTTITLPASLKEKMSEAGVNWSEEIREMISQRLEEDDGLPDMTEALLLNERVRRPAPKGWSSLEEIKRWRKRTPS